MISAFSVNAEVMSCKQMEILATHTATQAFEETRNHLDLVDERGLFDTWMMITAQLIQMYKQPEYTEFIETAKISGVGLIQMKAEIVKKAPPEKYAYLFGKSTFATCNTAEKKGWRE